MSGPPPPGALPPEVPEEFAAAYRAAYERALEAQNEGPQHSAQPEDRPALRDPEDTDELPARHGRLAVGTHRTESYDDEPTLFEKITDSPWLVPLLLTLLALLLILGAYAIGRAFAGRVDHDSGSGSDSFVMSDGGSAGTRQPTSTQPPGKGAWAGHVKRVADVRAKASCTSPSGQDGSGDAVSYDAANLTDGVADTTWRCNGAAIGKKLTFSLSEKTPIGEVGLIPGYAKTDKATGDDRYAENNRVTKVRWTIGDIVVEQTMSGSSDDRSLRLLRVPKTDTDQVELEILAVKKGSRNTTAISEIQLGRAD